MNTNGVRQAFLAVVALVLGAVLPPGVFGLSLYDDFSGGAIDAGKWVNLDVVQEIRGGKLVSIHRAAGPPGNPGNFLNFANPASIQTFQADVCLNAYSPPPGGSSRVRLRGNYYNDGTSGPGATGDVRAQLYIRGTASGVNIRYNVYRCTDANCNTATDVIPTTTVKTASLGEIHVLAIGWNGAVFTFTVDGVPTVVDPRPSQPIVTPVPNVPGKTLSTQLIIVGPGGTGSIAGDYDNVLVNGAPYDDFSGSLLNPVKWATLELVRQVAGGKFVSKAARAGAAGTDLRNRFRPINQNAVTALRADVTVTAFQSTNSFVQARWAANFYNDGASTGGIDFTGDVSAYIRVISDNGAQLTVQFFADRCNDPECNTSTILNNFFDFLGQVNPGETHTLSLAWNGSVFTYGVGAITRTFDPKPFAPVVKPAVGHFNDLRTAALVRASGGHGYIGATFDNIFVNDEAIVLPRLAPFLQESVTGDVTTDGVGLRGSGTGTINLTGIPAGATVQRALLYWATVGTAGTFTSPTLNGAPVSGILIGRSDDSFWGGLQSFAYRADVTALVPGNGAYTIAGLPAAGPTVNDSTGASLVAIYSLPGAPSRIVSINDGAVTLSGPRLQSYTTSLSGFVAADPPAGAKLSFVVGDGQAFTPEFAGVNTTLLATNEFSGSDGPFWDTRTYDVSTVTPAGATIADAIISTGDDGLVWVAAILSVPGGAPPASLLLGLGPGGAGWLEVLEGRPPHANERWLQLPFAAYNTAVGETRPSFCDLDGDGTEELLLGLGPYPPNGGWLEVREGAARGYAHRAWLRVRWPAYNSTNGETLPACGDLDGDGKAEIVVGLGAGGGGWLQAFDDATTGFTPLPGTPTAGGWLRLPWPAYNSSRGETHPTLGNLDADPAPELAIGLGEGGAGWVHLVDDAASGFTPLPGTPTAGGWLQLRWPAYNSATGETRPALCDLAGDGQAELVLGLGQGGAGWLQLFEAGTWRPLPGTPTAGGWLQVPFPAYNTANGETFPACQDLDGDPPQELLLGLGRYPENGGWVEVREDLPGGLAHRSWARVRWPVYTSTNGLTRPAGGP